MKIWFDTLEIQLRIKCVRVPERGTEAERERKTDFHIHLSKARILPGFLYCVEGRVDILRTSLPEREWSEGLSYTLRCAFYSCLTDHIITPPSWGLDEGLRDQLPKYSKVLTLGIKTGRQEEGKSSSSYAGYMLLI